ncbi:MAG: hypothetical protein KDA45_08215 [Planctomycetales bacterium]|nr:hypothetical protein [Planctomycetales bacterium]
MKLVVIAGLLFGILLLSGCDTAPKLVPVSGSVTVKGKEVAGAVVLFHPLDPELMPASGVTAGDGTFTLVSGPDAGIRPGKYKVTVTWPDPKFKPSKAAVMMGTAEDGPDLLKGRYATKDKTTLTAEIAADTTQLPPFEL